MTPKRYKTSLFHQKTIEFQRKMIVDTLEAHHGSRTLAAKTLGISRTYLFRLIRTHGIGKA